VFFAVHGVEIIFVVFHDAPEAFFENLGKQVVVLQVFVFNLVEVTDVVVALEDFTRRLDVLFGLDQLQPILDLGQIELREILLIDHVLLFEELRCECLEFAEPHALEDLSHDVHDVCPTFLQQLNEVPGHGFDLYEFHVSHVEVLLFGVGVDHVHFANEGDDVLL